MEDTKHFLAQNGLNGAVFFLFAAGFWIVANPVEAWEKLAQFVQLQNASVIVSGLFAAVLAPILGFVVQGMVLAFHYFRGHPYVDTSRQTIAQRIRERISASKVISQEIKQRIEKVADDSIFVAVYYREAPERLIEWARRRRDSQHLGENWATAGACGVAFSIFSELIAHLPEGQRLVVLKVLGGICFAAWVISFLYMRSKMKREADGMELVWALIYLYPEISRISDSGNPDATAQ